MIRKAIALVIGFVVGSASVAAGHAVSSIWYPMPEGLDFNDADAMKAFVDSLPPAALVTVLAAHASGALVAGFVCSLIMRRHWLPGSLTLGVLFTLAGISNLVSIPSPLWFAVVDLMLYLPAALVGGAAAGLFGARDKPSV